MSLPQVAEALLRQRLIVVAIAVGAFIAAMLVTAAVPTVYESTATLAVGGNQNEASGTNEVEADATLARTYAELLESASATDAAVRALPFRTSADALAGKVSFEAVGGTSLLKITAADADPRRAQAIAETYATSFVRVQHSSARAAASEALRDSTRRLRELARRVHDLRTRGGPDAIPALEQANTELEAERDAYRASRQNVALQSSNVSVASPAQLPDSPARPRPKLYLFVGAIFAAVLGIFGGLIRDSFDTRLRDERDLVEVLGAPVLARLPRAGRSPERSAELQEAFQLLRANFELQDPERRLRTVGVTSSARDEGRTLVVAGLSSSLARVAEDVVAVDCDLRRPALHDQFGVDGSRGLSQALEEPPVTRTAEPAPRRLSAGGYDAGREIVLTPIDGSLPTLLRDSGIPNLLILPAGPRTADAAVLLTRERLTRVLATLRRSADYVVCDIPPVTLGGDAAAACASVDAVIVVVDTRSAQRSAVVAMREQLERAGTRAVGVVVNRGAR